MTPQNERVAAATRLVEKYVMGSMAIGLIPIPAVDVAGLFAQQLYMLKQVGRIYGQELSDDVGRKTIAALLGGLAPTALLLPAASLLRVVPVVGHFVSLFTMPMLSGAATYALGRVFIDHFESGGTALTLNPARLRQNFRTYYDDGRKRIAANGAVTAGGTPPPLTPEANTEVAASQDNQSSSPAKPVEGDSGSQTSSEKLPVDVGVGTDSQLWTRDTLNSNSTLLPNSGSVIGVSLLATEIPGVGAESGLTSAQRSASTPIYEYHATGPWRYQYSTNPNIGGGWIKDGVAFYAFASQVEDTVPIHQYHATGPWRYQYSANPNIGGGWIKDGVAFYAYSSQVEDAVPIHEYHATDPWRYQYSTNPNIGGGWIKDGVAFYLLDRDPADKA